MRISSHQQTHIRAHKYTHVHNIYAHPFVYTCSHTSNRTNTEDQPRLTLLHSLYTQDNPVGIRTHMCICTPTKTNACTWILNVCTLTLAHTHKDRPGPHTHTHTHLHPRHTCDEYTHTHIYKHTHEEIPVSSHLASPEKEH